MAKTFTSMAEKRRAERQGRQGDGHTDAGTDLFFHGVDAVFGPEQPGQAFNMRDPRQVEARLKARHARSAK